MIPMKNLGPTIQFIKSLSRNRKRCEKKESTLYSKLKLIGPTKEKVAFGVKFGKLLSVVDGSNKV